VEVYALQMQKKKKNCRLFSHDERIISYRRKKT